MNLGGGRLFVITAGMMSENTAAHNIGLRMIEDEKQAIFFVGYTDPDTPGGRLRAAPPGEPFLFSPSGGELTRRCELDSFDLTAHANRQDVLDFIGEVEPRTVLLTHGDDAARAWYQDKIQERFPRIRVLQPGPGETVEA
jgi:Cft2 family RNA processing exonuclease